MDGTPARSSGGRGQVAQIVQPDRGSGMAGGVADLLCALISLAMSALTVSG